MPYLFMTLLVDFAPNTQSYFDELRKQYFPKHKLKDNAHLTLLYQIHLPKEQIIARLATIDIPELLFTAQHIHPFPYGNSIKIESEALISLHQTLKKLFKGKLTKRDLVKYRPHITVQLDVTAFKAQQTFAQLQETFQPITDTALGISLWEKNKKSSECVWKNYEV